MKVKDLAEAVVCGLRGWNIDPYDGDDRDIDPGDVLGSIINAVIRAEVARLREAVEWACENMTRMEPEDVQPFLDELRRRAGEEGG